MAGGGAIRRGKQRAGRGNSNWERQAANARLLAAAPKLLKALRNMVGMFDNRVVEMKLGPDAGGLREESCKIARAVIAEVEGIR